VQPRHESDFSESESDDDVVQQANLARVVRPRMEKPLQPEGPVYNLYGTTPGDLDDDDEPPYLCHRSDDESHPIEVKTDAELAAYIKARHYPDLTGSTMDELRMSLPVIPVSTSAGDRRSTYGGNAALLAGLPYAGGPYGGPKGVNGVVEYDIFTKYFTYSEVRQPAAIMNMRMWNLLPDERKLFYQAFAKIGLQMEDDHFLAQELILKIEDQDIWIKRLVDLICETDDDEQLTKHADTIRMVWRHLLSVVPDSFEWALRNMMLKRRQNIMGIASLQPDQRLSCVNGYWICRAPESEVFSGKPITGYYHNIHTNELFKYDQSHELLTTTIDTMGMETSTKVHDARERFLGMMGQGLPEPRRTFTELEAAIKRDLAETLKSFTEQSPTELPSPGVSAGVRMMGLQIIESDDIPVQGERDVNGERMIPPGTTLLTTTETVAAHIDSPDISGVTEYIPDTVTMSPKDEGGRRRSTRMPRMALATKAQDRARAKRIELLFKPPRFGPPRRASSKSSSPLVIPEPRSDTDSEMESTPVLPQGRLVRSGKATARA
jgi:hypothetical protein